MTQSTATQLRESLAAAARRLDFVALMEGGAIGALIGAGLLIVATIVGASASATLVMAVAIFCSAGGALARVALSRKRRRTLMDVAVVVERRVGNCRNVVVTAAELIEMGGALGSHERRRYLTDRILNEAAHAVSHMNHRELFPARNASLSLSGGLTLLLIFSALAIHRASSPPDLAATVAGGATISNVTLVVVPPSYTGRDSVMLRNPSHIEVLSGSRVSISASGVAAAVDVETIGGSARLMQRGSTFVGDVLVEADGFLALQPMGADSSAGSRRLIGVTANPDKPPTVRITTPGRDLRLEDGRRSISIETEAGDDISLSSLRLRFTKVSGSGEQFTFTEGEIPLQTEKPNSTSWRGKATWDLTPLSLAAGDMVVYRSEVRDSRPGAPPYESDSYIVEVPGPGALLAGGFSIDDEFDRYAVSQQMVILKSERLLARKDSLPVGRYAEESLNIAAEQRKVRAEFIFMMGGELAEEVTGDMAGLADLNEESHAALDDEAVAGRLANQGRLDIIRAIRSMSHASTSLNGARVDTALVHEKAALASLQRAFARTRYILRTLTERERIDLARRLSGPLATALRERGPVRRASPDSLSLELRGVIATLASIAGSDSLQRQDAQNAAGLSQRILRSSGAASQLREIAAQIDSGGTVLLQLNRSAARRHFESAIVGLTQLLRNRMSSFPQSNTAQSPSGKKLDGLLTDALRGVRR